jgi:DNA repair protein RadD
MFMDAEVVSAKTKPKERDRVINGFKDGSIKMVMNVGVLTTGFDHPKLDCIVLLRPTRSIGLYYQMVGRGLRKAEGKTSCAVVDMTDTVKKIGRVETIRVEKVDGKWELLTERGSWHAKELYRFEIQK